MPEQPFALSTIPSPPPAAERDYDAICATVMESARGRWFLAEFARRHRNAGTQSVLAAIERIETVIRGSRDQQAYQSFRVALLETTKTIAQTRAAVAEIKPEAQAQGKVTPGKAAGPDASPAPASPDIFGAAGRIQDVVWTMRERGLDPATCEQIEALASSILSASSLRDPNDRRAHKLDEVLQYLERRIDTMLREQGWRDAAIETATDAPAADAPAAAVDIVPDIAAPPSEPAPETSTALPSAPVELEIEPLVVVPVGPREVAAEAPAAELELAPIMVEPLLAPPGAEATAPTVTEPPPVIAIAPAAVGEAPEPVFGLPLDDTAPMTAAEIEEELFVLAPADTAPDAPSESSDAAPPAIPQPDAPAAPIVTAAIEQIAVRAAPMTAPSAATAASIARARPVAESMPRPAPSDPLAALKAMSDEELIALFT